MKVNIGNQIYMNRIIKIISPITYQTFKVELNGDEQEVKELLGTILEINPKLIKGLRDSFNNYYTISNALQNPLLYTNHNNYYTVLLKDISQSNFNNFSYKYEKYNQKNNKEKHQDKIYKELAKKLKSVIISNSYNSDRKENSKFNSSGKSNLSKNNRKSHGKKGKNKTMKETLKDLKLNLDKENYSKIKSLLKNKNQKIIKLIKKFEKDNDYDKLISKLNNFSNDDNKSDVKDVDKNKRTENDILETITLKIIIIMKEVRRDFYIFTINELEQLEDLEKKLLYKSEFNIDLVQINDENMDEVIEQNRDKIINYFKNNFSEKFSKLFSYYENLIYNNYFENEEGINDINQIYDEIFQHNDFKKLIKQIKKKIEESTKKLEESIDKSDKDEIVDISSQINEIFSKTEVTQYFTNTLDKSIELSILFPINKKLSMIKFEITIDNKTIRSKIFPKEKAEEKYNDAIASGKVGFNTEYDGNYKSFKINIGNLLPKKQVKLKCYFIEMINTNDLSYEFNIMENYPAFYYKKSDENPKNKKIRAVFNIQTQSRITRLILPFLNNFKKINFVYKINYSEDYKKAEIIYKNTQPDEGNNYNLNILFRTEDMNKPILYCQYNPNLNETAYSINYTYISKKMKAIPNPKKPDEDNNVSYVDKYEKNEINDLPGLFIFLIDQSGSMAGDPIELVKDSLLLFIQSLPKGSFFQLIGFGSNFKKYNQSPFEYNKENVDNIINLIKNLKADLGGTNITNPLTEIFNDDSYSKINLSKNLLLLTDGYVENIEECFNLIESNSKKFRVNSIGIGKDFDKILVEKCGQLGKGSSYFVENLENINSVIIEALNKGLRPYITNIKFEFENYKEEILSNIIISKPVNNFSYQNEIINYSFILPGNKELSDLKIKITGKDPLYEFEKNYCFDKIFKLEKGEEMSKMIVSKALKNNEELLKDDIKEIEFAKKYQILSKNTAFFGEISNEENQQNELINVNLFNFKKSDSSDDHEEKNNCLISPMSNLLCRKKCKKKMKSKLIFKHKIVNEEISFNKEIQLSPLRKINERMSKKNILYKKSIDSGLFLINDDMNLILSQDIIEGFWDKNDKTERLVDIITLDKFKKIKDNVISFGKGENENKIIYTILVLYYLKTKSNKNLDEYKLVIKKAKQFLKKNGINYEEFITNIFD